MQPDLFLKHPVAVSLSGSGNLHKPGARGVALVGVARSDVRRVVMTLGNGKSVSLPVNAHGAFRYEIAAAEAGTAAAPVAVAAYDNAGRLLGTRPLR